MKEALPLVLVLFLVYLSQCFASAPPLTVVFFLKDRLRGRSLRRYLKTSPSGKRIFLVNPFLPHVGAVYTESVPFAVRVDAAGEFSGIQALMPQSADSPNILSFGEPHEIEASGTEVLVDDEVFLSLRTAPAAEQTARLLSEVQNTARKNRISLLERHFKKMFSAKMIEEQLDLYSRSTGYLQSACFSLFFIMFLLGPVAIFVLGLHRVWLALLLYIIFLLVSILWLFRRAYRRLYPQKTTWPLQNMVTIAFSPFAAIRANDLLVSELLAEYHPVAVAQHILAETDFREFTSAALRKAQFLDSDAFLVKFIHAFLVQNGFQPESFLRPPNRENPNSQTYCPVCLTEYVIASGACKDCNNTPLAVFAADRSGIGEAR
jgi:hypothetical protein